MLFNLFLKGKMLIQGPNTPFYLMTNTKEFHPGIPPDNSREEVLGLEGAIEATKRKIEDYKESKTDVSELEFHLRKLEQAPKEAKKNQGNDDRAA